MREKKVGSTPRTRREGANSGEEEEKGGKREAHKQMTYARRKQVRHTWTSKHGVNRACESTRGSDLLQGKLREGGDDAF